MLIYHPILVSPLHDITCYDSNQCCYRSSQGVDALTNFSSVLKISSPCPDFFLTNEVILPDGQKDP